VPRSPRVLPDLWGGGSGGIGIILCVVCGGHNSIYNFEALPRGVVAIRLRVEIWLCGGVEASAPLFR
jgi:hypothetical protein